MTKTNKQILFEKIYNIDKKAAAELALLRMSGFKVNNTSLLVEAFSWCDTPQGTTFWANISDALGESDL